LRLREAMMKEVHSESVVPTGGAANGPNPNR
jgi:hypothetical protein